MMSERDEAVIADNTPPGPPDGDTPDDAGQNGEDPIKLLIDRIEALKGYTGHFAQAKVDGVKVRARKLYARALATLVTVLVIAATVTTGAVYVVHGTAIALTAAFGGRAWLGYLLAGLMCVGGVVGTSAIGIWLGNRRRRHEIVDQYEQRKSIERSRYGRDVDQAARGAA
jgi:hypothetical protein